MQVGSSVVGQVSAAEGAEAAAGLNQLTIGNREGRKGRQKRKKASKKESREALKGSDVVPSLLVLVYVWRVGDGAVSIQCKPLRDACGAGRLRSLAVSR